MRNMEKFQYGVIGLIALILVAQTASVAYAHHNDNYNPRKDMKSKSEKIDAEKKVKNDKIQAAYVEYYTAFNAWITASSDYKIAKISGDSQDRKDAKENRSSAYDNMMQKWDAYLESKK
jgi:hypothetical protein